MRARRFGPVFSRSIRNAHYRRPGGELRTPHFTAPTGALLWAVCLQSRYSRRLCPATVAMVPEFNQLLTAFAGLMLIGCAADPVLPTSAADPERASLVTRIGTTEVEIAAETVALQTHILVAEMAIQRGLRKRASEAYVAALAYSDDPQLAERATQIALFADQLDLAYRAARAWAEADPDSENAHRTAARLALRAGEAERLRRYANAVVNLHLGGIGEGFRVLADVLSGEDGGAGLALATMADLVAEHPQLAQARYAQAVLALRYERYAVAEEAVARALALRPGWTDAALLRAGVLVREGKLVAAKNWIAGLAGSPAERADYQLGYARMLLDAGDNAAAADAFERALALRPDYADARYGLGVLALTLEQWDRAEQAFARLYDAGERRADAAYYLGAIAESREDYVEARRWYQRVEGGGHSFEAQIRAARMLGQMGDLAAARRELAAMRRANPELAKPLYLAEGELLFRAGEFDAALAHYNQAVAQAPQDPDLLYARSLVYEKLGAIAKAEADLRTILEADADDARALNALGYMLTNHSSRYQEALDYIQRALKAQPEDPAVIDSMGWIQYRLGNLPKARDYLQQAYKKFPDPEVAAHFGEVLWQLGNQAKARRIWQEALAQYPDHRVLLETVERLTP